MIKIIILRFIFGMNYKKGDLIILEVKIKFYIICLGKKAFIAKGAEV